MGTEDRDQGLSVVVVDDDPLILRVVQELLKQEGVPVRAFDRASSALDWVREQGADLVISDVHMPAMDGFQLLKGVQAVAPDCEVVFMTAHTDVRLAIQAVQAGAVDFLLKPVSADSLRAALARSKRFSDLKRERGTLARRAERLGEQLAGTSPDGTMVGASEAMAQVTVAIQDLGPSNATILILGESGTGKEVVAAALHRASARAAAPFIAVNCAAIPELLFESEMFGHRKGAFSGATEARGGFVDAAEGGTLFLDEIGDMPLPLQAKVLRLMEQKTFMGVGDRQEKRADLRILAATNQDLEERCQEKLFRQDLYFRLNVCPIVLPPLRDRREDIPALARFFFEQLVADVHKPLSGLSEDFLAALATHDFPGNVRELRNVIEASILRCRHDGELHAADLPDALAAGSAAALSDGWPLETVELAAVEARLVSEALRRTDGNVSAAARQMGVSRGKLRGMMEEHGVAGNED